VKNQGDGMLWYSAFFVSMPEFTAMHFGRWKVSADLLIEGDGSVDGPALGAFSADATIGFTGSGTLTVEKLFEADAYIDFLVSEES
jgi:hypothetical protein